MTNSTSFWQSLYQQSQNINLQNRQVEHLQLNHDLTQSAIVNTAESNWLPSPAKGVKRIVLEREGGEKTIRATSLVAYDPNSKFAPHQHPLGEEFFVLSGTFSDQNGNYPAGTYVRNPPASSHQPFSKKGCMIWVKLQQFEASDRQHVVIDTAAKHHDFVTDKMTRKVLFNKYESVELVEAIVNTTIPKAWFENGLEILILAGQLAANNEVYEQGHWLRYAAGQKQDITVMQGCELLIKYAHLD